MHVRMWRSESEGEEGTQAVTQAGDRQSLLVFLPGQDEIREARAALEDIAGNTVGEWARMRAGGSASESTQRKK